MAKQGMTLHGEARAGVRQVGVTTPWLLAGAGMRRKRLQHPRPIPLIQTANGVQLAMPTPDPRISHSARYNDQTRLRRAQPAGTVAGRRSLYLQGVHVVNVVDHQQPASMLPKAVPHNIGWVQTASPGLLDLSGRSTKPGSDGQQPSVQRGGIDPGDPADTPSRPRTFPRGPAPRSSSPCHPGLQAPQTAHPAS